MVCFFFFSCAATNSFFFFSTSAAATNLASRFSISANALTNFLIFTFSTSTAASPRSRTSLNRPSISFFHCKLSFVKRAAFRVSRESISALLAIVMASRNFSSSSLAVAWVWALRASKAAISARLAAAVDRRAFNSFWASSSFCSINFWAASNSACNSTARFVSASSNSTISFRTISICSICFAKPESSDRWVCCSCSNCFCNFPDSDISASVVVNTFRLDLVSRSFSCRLSSRASLICSSSIWIWVWSSARGFCLRFVVRRKNANGFRGMAATTSPTAFPIPPPRHCKTLIIGGDGKCWVFVVAAVHSTISRSVHNKPNIMVDRKPPFDVFHPQILQLEFVIFALAHGFVNFCCGWWFK
mmetsp:Transcript_58162/g.70009  ORF Transcript_58162/g.70009 Transcript_58162/m.70009 type:complete len:360 (+) Transcript_58162:318-1397(+)